MDSLHVWLKKYNSWTFYFFFLFVWVWPAGVRTVPQFQLVLFYNSQHSQTVLASQNCWFTSVSEVEDLITDCQKELKVEQLLLNVGFCTLAQVERIKQVKVTFSAEVQLAGDPFQIQMQKCRSLLNCAKFHLIDFKKMCSWFLNKDSAALYFIHPYYCTE